MLFNFSKHGEQQLVVKMLIILKKCEAIRNKQLKCVLSFENVRYTIKKRPLL